MSFNYPVTPSEKLWYYVGPKGGKMSTAWNQWQQPAGYSEAKSEDLSDLTKAELQEKLEAKGLPTSGNKDELIARLNEAD